MMLISDNKVDIDTSKYKSFEKIGLARNNLFFKRFLFFLSAILMITLFLPWTQNVRMKGKLTTLLPNERPQTIHATIPGRIEQWYVREGQFVKKGDTIVYLSEIKTEYFDPELLARTKEQVNAKQSAIGSYAAKVKALDQQIVQFKQELHFKQEQINNKIAQTKLKAEAEKQDIQAVRTALNNEQKQLMRTEELFKKGLKSLTDLENKRAKYQELEAKLVSAENKYQQSIQEIQNLTFQLSGVDSEYTGKIAKTESEKQSTMGDKFATEGETSKLQNQYSNYALRSQFYYIKAPIDCYITKTMKTGIGETIKEGEDVVSIVPANMNLAVEAYIKPLDLPLLKIGTSIRFMFDGWPAFVFSGWPNASIGMYSGKVYAIDKVANEKGMFRLIVAPDPNKPSWPDALRPGAGASGFALLENVPIWYEVWRQLNGFPPNFYTDLDEPSIEIKK